jgi:flagellar hook protein FlgE
MTTFFTALSALQADQNWMEVLGNNLANTNTPGYKGSYATFAEQFNQTLRDASEAANGLGGTNPAQIGMGVRMANVGRDFEQGALTTTGRAFDMAINGRSFFALSGGQQTLYTRVGTFGLDGSGSLVDQRSGLKVLDPNGNPISIDENQKLPPKSTGSISISGNLPKVSTGPLPEILGTTSLTSGTNAVVTGTVAGPYTIPAGETWTLKIRVSGGATQTASVTSTTGTVTAADVASAIDALSGVSATVNGSGDVVVTSDDKGTAATIDIDPGSAGHDLASLVGLSTSPVAGTESPVTGSTLINDLVPNHVAYQNGDQIQINGVDSDGSTVSTVFTYGSANDGTTVQNLVNFLGTAYPASTVALDSNGNITITAKQAGVAHTQLTLSDAAGNTGITAWSNTPFTTTQEGTDPDRVTTSSQVFDAAGTAHLLTWTFERQGDGTWTATPTMPAADGTVLSPPITGIKFGDDGTPQGFDGLVQTLSVRFTGQVDVQTAHVSLGTDGKLDGLTQFGTSGDPLVVNQDGYAPGDLTSMSVDQTGSIKGFYSNGQTQTVAQLGLATFVNPEGLHDVGGGMFAVSANSGNATLGQGNTNGAGTVLGGTLESSNVDTATQLVLLIEAQRSYQANAKVVTAQDQILQTTVTMT